MLKHRAAVALFAGLVLLVPTETPAQVSRDEFEALKSEVGSLKEALKNQADVLRQLLQRTGHLRDSSEAPFKGVAISLDGAPVYGQPDAKVTIVEFSDYQCPFCARYALDTFLEIERDYIQSGRVRYLYRDYPIEGAHPQAFKAHEAVRCAGEQGKRREMHDKVFSSQKALSVPALSSYAQGLGVDRAAFDRCIASGVYSAKIRSDIAQGQQVGVRGTPTFFLGLTQPNSPMFIAVRRIVGAQPYAAFKAAIDELLALR